MVCASIIDGIISFDQRITLFLNDLNCAASDQFWLIFSNRQIWVITYLVCAFFLFRRLGWKKALMVLLSVALAFAACDQFSNLVKSSPTRLRPGYNYWMVSNGVHILEGRGGFYGFFSAHAANSFACERAFDDSRDVGHHERSVVVVAYNAEIRFKRRECIIGNLGLCRGH